MACSLSKRHEADISLHHLAENIAYTACSNPNAICSRARSPSVTIHDKILQLYLQQFSHQSTSNFATNPRACPNLLSKLVARDKLNTLVLNLKPIDEGYSLCLKSMAGHLVETSNMSYSDTELLKMIEQEELPHTLVDLLEKAQPELFYDGCIIAEIRDSRRAIKGAYKTSFILLKPSHRSLLADINAMTNDQFRWSQDDRLALESKLLLATSEPLCLNPNGALSIIRNRLAGRKRVALTEQMRRSLRPYNTRAILRRKAYSKISCHRDLPIMAFLERRGDKSKYPNSTRESQHKPLSVDSWRRIPPELSTAVDTSQVERLAKAGVFLLATSKQGNNDCTPTVVEEYLIETERPVGKLHKSRLVILKKSSDDKFVGELHVDGAEGNCNKCTFDLGTAPLKDKYIHQFIEIYTEEGRRQVKITHTQPGQTPSIVYNTGAGNSERSTQIQFSSSTNQSTLRFSTDSQSTGQLPPDSQSTHTSVDNSQSVSRFTVDNQSAIKFSLTSQPGSLSLSSSLPQEAVVASGERSLRKEQLTNLSLVQSMKSSAGTSANSKTADSQGGSKTALLMSNPQHSSKLSSQVGKAGSSIVQLSSGSQSAKLIGIQTSFVPTSSVSLQNLAGLQTGSHNVQVSLTSIGAQSGIAVPVSLLSGISGNQPIFLSGPLPVVDNSSTSEQATGTGLAQSLAPPSTASSRLPTSTTQAGSQQITAGSQGVITLPGQLVQHLLAANKQQEQVNVINAPAIANQQLSTQLLANQQGAQSTANQKSSGVPIGKLLGNQQVPIQIGHLSSNQQSPSVQIAHQIITQNAGGTRQVRAQNSSTSRASSMQVFHQSSLPQVTQISSSQLNIITTQASGMGGQQQVLHIPPNLTIAHISGSAQQQGRLTTPIQQLRLTTPTQQHVRLATPQARSNQQARVATPTQQTVVAAPTQSQARVTMPIQQQGSIATSSLQSARLTTPTQQGRVQTLQFRGLRSPSNEEGHQ